MHHHQHTDYVEVVAAKGPAQISGKTKAAFIGMMIVGILAFCYGAFVRPERIGWISFLHNFYFFTGLSAAGVVIACIIHITNSIWGRPIKRYAESYGAFLIWSIPFAVLLYFGHTHLYEWAVGNTPPDEHLFPNKAAFLKIEWVLARVIGALILIWLFAKQFTKLSSRADLGVASEKNPDKWTAPANWRGAEVEVAESQAKQMRFGVLYCFVYGFGISILAYDLLMSLDYRWLSTMFGGWNFTSFMLMGWGSLVLVTSVMSKQFGVDHYMHKLLYHDLGKLTFGFTVVWGYLTFAQVMVIWYGNLPHEAGWFTNRIFTDTWMPFTIVTVFLVFVIPFILGLGKKRKMSPATFGPVVVISLCGIWLERFMLITPSAWYFDRNVTDPLQGSYQGGIAELLVIDILVGLGFLGLFCWCFLNHLYKNPVMVIADPRLGKGINRH